ncbi:nuclear transport factor 2 family protein [Streptomyces sp. NPDC049555]|uniref:nuclear transport factor 2 family protein n=1 Tax=unclassified Streptomyces TaxID=2593676 RepID=UPI00341204E1
MNDTPASVVAAAFHHYRSQNREAALQLYAEDFTFTSPQDDHIDRTAFFDRCFPTASRMKEQHLLHITPAGPELVFVLYEYELTTGARHRNMEAITVRDGLIHEAQVFFGGPA